MTTCSLVEIYQDVYYIHLLLFLGAIFKRAVFLMGTKPSGSFITRCFSVASLACHILCTKKTI